MMKLILLLVCTSSVLEATIAPYQEEHELWEIGVPSTIVEHAAKMVGTHRKSFGIWEILLYGVPHILEQAKLVDRTLDVVELFSGCSELSHQCDISGLASQPFDMKRHRSENILTMEGFLYAGWLVSRIKRNGLLWAAPQCSTWGSAALALTKRHLTVFGDQTRQDVLDANVTLELVVWLCFFAAIRGVNFCIEQPKGSYWYKHPSALALKEGLLGAGIKDVLTWMGAFAHEMPKPTTLWTNMPCGAMFLMARGKPKNLKSKPEFHFRKQRKSGKGSWWQGGKKLKSSQGYTEEFCKRVAAAVTRCQV
jgi:hypothetical protein